MDFSFLIVLWIIFLIVQNVSDKKKSPPPPRNTTPIDFEIPNLANDPNFPGEENQIFIDNPKTSAEVREIKLNEFYNQKTFEDSRSATKKFEEAGEKKLPFNLNPESAVNGIILGEILGKPKSLRRR